MEGKKARGLAVPNPDRRRCTAHRKNGERCKNPPIQGTTVCGAHGGRAPQVRRKAVERIIAASDLAAARLIEFMNDKRVPYNVRLAATRDLLDRGIGPAAQTVKLGLAESTPLDDLLNEIISDPNFLEDVPTTPALRRGTTPTPTRWEDDDAEPVQYVHAGGGGVGDDEDDADLSWNTPDTIPGEVIEPTPRYQPRRPAAEYGDPDEPVQRRAQVVTTARARSRSVDPPRHIRDGLGLGDPREDNATFGP